MEAARKNAVLGEPERITVTWLLAVGLIDGTDRVVVREEEGDSRCNDKNISIDDLCNK